MATTTTPTPVGEETPSSEGTRRGDEARRRFAIRPALTWAAILVGLAAAVTLALVALLGPSDAGRVTGDHSGLIEHGSIRAHEGSVEDLFGAPAADSGLIENGSIRAHEGSVEDLFGAPAAGDHSGLIENGSIRAHEGSVEDLFGAPAAGDHSGLVEHGSVRAHEGSSG